MTREFVAAVDAYAADRQIPVVHFEKGQRKKDVARPHFQRAEREGRYGVVMLGISQERANVFRPPAKGQRQVIVDAHRYVDTGRKVSSVVIGVVNEDPARHP